ncbi:hypothetical protein WICMUC_002122 [Wickerhamomyces mucosus]|uniref:1-phosphatidylinositol 4-kinase n=1 Tax=Wickerhamomyces mucosus TaxID=1378264 RepID=A0A9P8PRI3_9ASCO|nr:hypothetical protein WICMUC_002122 [Wickerhamomyces mucosus]
MDYLGIRSKALSKLATFSLLQQQQEQGDQELSVSKLNGSSKINRESSISSGLNGDILKLSKTLSRNVSEIPITHKELEILFALSQTSPAIQNINQANELLELIIPYFLESPNQRFKSNISLQLSPSPWDYLTENLTTSIIKISDKFPELREKSIQTFINYLTKFQKKIGFNDQSDLKLSNYFSLIGFLKSLIKTESSITISLIEKIIELFNVEFLDNIEVIISKSLEEEYDYAYLLTYRSLNEEFNSLLFTKYIQELSHKILLNIASPTLLSIDDSSINSLVDYLVLNAAKFYDDERDFTTSIIVERLLSSSKIVNLLVGRALDQLNELDDGATYINLSTTNRISLAYQTKAFALEVIGAGLITNRLSSIEVSDIIQNSLNHLTEVLDIHLAPTIISLSSLLNFKENKSISGELIHSFPLIISKLSSNVDDDDDDHDNNNFINRISKFLALGMKPLTQDSIITTIYSLVNLLNNVNNDEPTHLTELKLKSARATAVSNGHLNNNRPTRSNTIHSLKATISYSSLDTVEQGVKKHVFKNAINSIVEIVSTYQDNSITDLSSSFLSQKIGRISSELDYYLFDGLTKLVPILDERQFTTLTTAFDILMSRGQPILSSQVIDARIKIAECLSKDINHPLYKIYLLELFNNAVTKGDVQTSEQHRSHGEISEVAKQISVFLKPLSILLPKNIPLTYDENDIELINSSRNFWFNLVVHGYNETSSLTATYQKELEIIALNSPALASEFPRLHTETSFELNTILRRGSSNHNVKDQKHMIGGFANTTSLELHTLSYPKLMFLSATLLLENLRANTGDCSTILQYFSDPSISKTNIEKFIGFISISIVQKFINLALKGNNPNFTADSVATQLTKILIACCHRNDDLQDAAFQCANLLLSRLPSGLCHHKSLFTLLDILSSLFDSIIDINRSKYEPKREFPLKRSNAKIAVSDSVKWRKQTLEKLHKKAREWCLLSLNKSSQDMKSLLQAYVSDLGLLQRIDNVEFGVSFAIELAGTILPTDLELSNIPSTTLEKPDSIAGFLSQYTWRAKNIADKANIVEARSLLKTKDIKLSSLKTKLHNDEIKIDEIEVLEVLDIIASILILKVNEEDRAGLVHELVSLPFKYFTSNIMKVATSIWLGIIKEREDDLSFLLLSEIAISWEISIKNKKGLFSKEFDLLDEGFLRMTYSPTDMKTVNYNAEFVSKILQTHLHVIKFFSSHFQGTLLQSKHLLKIFTEVVYIGLKGLKHGSTHPFARIIRNELIKFGLDVLQLHLKSNSSLSAKLIDVILDGVLSWFTRKSHYPFGSNYIKIEYDLKLLVKIFDHIKALSLSKESLVSKRELSLLFLKHEISQIFTWVKPLDLSEYKGDSGVKVDNKYIKLAFELNPILAFRLVEIYPKYSKVLNDLISADPSKVLKLLESVEYYLQNSKLIKYLVFAKPVSPTDSINLFQSSHFENPYVIQYNMRSLESHDVNLTFFYVPQIVQSLRNDKLGYVGRFIVETGKVNQLFAHQIIWNMLANRYQDEDSTIEDPVKTSIDFIMEKMIKSFSEKDLIFYKKEFKFFNEVTDISGKLKPYIKKTKAEKKLKIDEEMKKIEVVQNVYLPSNPDGVVVDINRTSGKPLQSHAKAPFMATFKVRKQETVAGEQLTIEKWQSAIFKVGDDCRQDVLALQLISIFKSIWNNSGLDLYVFPYRVTATAPGCGVIDVLPNSISRDMLGREAVNGLYEYFSSKFGNENSSEFELARHNFIKSLAGYSIISYLLQFKDRHNGNIMYDDQGHVLHIDFGFCFDIVPGGVKFEAVPFKLTKEMVKVMGGSSETESFKMFEELFIQGFLSVRPHCELIIGNVSTMLGSGLPCFKGEKTIKNLRNRFFLHKDDRECISALKGLIRSSYESIFTVGYDRFQKITNGIPY